MFNSFIYEVLLKNYEKPTESSSSGTTEPSKMHKCALNWSDTCAHCEMGYDHFKQNLSNASSASDHLKHKLNEYIAKLTGNLNRLFHFNIINIFILRG